MHFKLKKKKEKQNRIKSNQYAIRTGREKGAESSYVLIKKQITHYTLNSQKQSPAPNSALTVHDVA